MGNLNGSVVREGLSSSSGSAYEITDKHLNQQEKHQLTLVPDPGASGKVNIRVRGKGVPDDFSETLYSDGFPAEVDLADSETIVFSGAFDAVILDCTAVTGTFAAYLESR
jgi:hypothetical protein